MFLMNIFLSAVKVVPEVAEDVAVVEVSAMEKLRKVKFH